MNASCLSVNRLSLLIDCLYSLILFYIYNILLQSNSVKFLFKLYFKYRQKIKIISLCFIKLIVNIIDTFETLK